MTQMPSTFFGVDLQEEFCGRAVDVLTALEDHVDKANHSSFQAFRRELHSLKGNAQAFGVDDVATLCHRLEDVMDGHTAWSAPIETQAGVYLAHLSVLLERLSAAS